MQESLYIIDVFSLVFQVFHAIAPMTGPAGQPTNAVFGFTRDLLTILKEHRPTYLLCAMDSPGPGVRNEIYPLYKANRAEIPPDLEPQIPLVQQVIEGFGVPAVSFPKWEADDVIATVARRAVEQGVAVSIVTNDKDVRQLLGPNVRLFNIRKNTFMDEAFLKDDWGIRPDQVVDFQSLVGDGVDNVPGVPLVGPKKACALLGRFETLDEVLAHADEAPGKKLQENLKKFAGQALVSRKLVRLNTELPLEFDLQSARVHPPDAERLLPLFRELGFRRFGDEIRAIGSESSAAASSGSSAGQENQAGQSGRPERQWEIVDTDERFAAFLSTLAEQKTFCVDLETTGLDAMRADIVGWAFSWQPHSGHYIPVQGPPGQAVLEPPRVLEALRPFLEDPQREICNQNIKYDMLVLRRAGVQLQGVGVDPMVGNYLLDAGARSHGLDALAQRYLNHRMIPISELIGTGKRQKKMFDVDVQQAAEYAAEDADIAFQLAQLIAEELRSEGLWDLYWNLERPLISVLAEMEFAGVRVDVPELERQSETLSRRLESLIQEIYQIAGAEFNIGSPLQLRKILFEDLKLPIVKKTKTGASTDQEVLEELAATQEHPLPAKIVEYRQLTKLKGTYLDALPKMVNPETGKIHASFNQVVAATGRLSSSDPNLQNIPVRTEEGRLIRRAFVPSEPGWKLVCADYSQIELRILAHFSGDAVLLEAFRQGADIHTAVAAEVFGIPADDVTPEMRRLAKAVNFGVVYGQSPFGLASVLKISQDEAAAFIDNYFLRYADVDRYLLQILKECEQTGYAKTILGRRRRITGLRPSPGRQRTLSERTAINSVIQGSAADLIKQAMVNIHARLGREENPARMLLQIHDELIFETPHSQVDSLIDLVRTEMEHAFELNVPLVVDVSVGDNWLDVEGR